MLKPGDRVERYVVEGELGQGALATVYKVRHSTLGTVHALKVVKIAHREARERLIKEGRVQAQLNHENIVNVTDVLNVKGSPATLMEFVRGIDLEALLQRHFLDLDEALALFRGIVCGVGHAHAKGLVHRDLKPANVMLAVHEGRVIPKVTDFGLVKAVAGDEPIGATRSGATMGTPGFMPPEQIRDASTVDRRADMWALGCILYRMVCHMPAFPQGDLIELFSAVGAGNIPDPRSHVATLPDNVVDAIHALLKIEPTERMQSCTALLELLDDGVAPPSPSETLLPPLQPETWRRCYLADDSKAGASSIEMMHAAEKELELTRSAHPTMATTPGVTLAPDNRRKGGVWVVGGMLLLGLALIGVSATGGVGIVSTLLWNDAVKATPPLPGPGVPAPVAPKPEERPPKPEPVPAPLPAPQEEPRPTTAPAPPPQPPTPTTSEPKPGPKTAPEPQPQPTPSPEPEPAPEPVPQVASGGAIVCEPCKGIAKTWVEADGTGKTIANQNLPPGTYHFRAQPTDSTLPTIDHLVVLGTNETVRLNCFGQYSKCVAK